MALESISSRQGRREAVLVRQEVLSSIVASNLTAFGEGIKYIPIEMTQATDIDTSTNTKRWISENVLRDNACRYIGEWEWDT